MTTTRLAIICGITSLLAGCAEEPPPRTVGEFLENRILLEATMVRCGQNRNQSKYEAECVNAREAINRIATNEEKERRSDLEAQFERKRKSLRRTQEAAAEARRRAADARRRREAAAYLGVPEDTQPGTETRVAIPPAPDPGTGDVGQAPEEVPQPEVAAEEDLEAVREELRSRQEAD